MTTARKAFLSIPVPDVAKLVAVKRVASKVADSFKLKWEPTEHWHLTLQYCGKAITDEACVSIKNIWKRVLREHDITDTSGNAIIKILPSLKLYGRFGNISVVECETTEALRKCVKEGRDTVCSEFPEIEPMRFPFSAHLTIGTIPLNKEDAAPSEAEKASYAKFLEELKNDWLVADGMGTFNATSVIIFGEADPKTWIYEVRDEIKLLYSVD